eukprot:43196-Amphidinium_carterae.3
MSGSDFDGDLVQLSSDPDLVQFARASAAEAHACLYTSRCLLQLYLLPWLAYKVDNTASDEMEAAVAYMRLRAQQLLQHREVAAWQDATIRVDDGTAHQRAWSHLPHGRACHAGCRPRGRSGLEGHAHVLTRHALNRAHTHTYPHTYVFGYEAELKDAAILLCEIAAAAYDAPKKFSCGEVLRLGRIVMKDSITWSMLSTLAMTSSPARQRSLCGWFWASSPHGSRRPSSRPAFNMDAQEHVGRVFIPYSLRLGSSAGEAVRKVRI